MLIRRLFLWAGAAWGVLAALVAAALAAAAAFVATWALILGDSPWPPSAGWVIGALALATGVAAFTGALAAARARAASAEQLPPGQARREALAWLASGIGSCCAVAVAAAVWFALERAEADGAQAVEVRYSALADAVHVPVHITLEVAPEAMTVHFVSEGQRAGNYRLTAWVAAPYGRAPLAQHSETLALEPGSRKHAFSFATKDVLEAYRRGLMPDGLGSVDQHLAAQVVLDPVLTAQEASLTKGRMPLARTGQAAARVRFDVVPEGARLLPFNAP